MDILHAGDPAQPAPNRLQLLEIVDGEVQRDERRPAAGGLGRHGRDAQARSGHDRGDVEHEAVSVVGLEGQLCGEGRLRQLRPAHLHPAAPLFGIAGVFCVLTNLDEDVISNLPATLSSGARTQILVGPENVAKELKDTSVVMTKFDIGDGMQGMIGVLGPTRMDYAQITARLSYFAENLGRMFQKSQTPALEDPKKNNTPEG